MSEDRLDRVERIVESNARSIEALTNSITELKQEGQKDRNRLYSAMSQMATGMAQASEYTTQITAAQSSLWEVQADYYRRTEEVDKRQEEMSKLNKNIIEILNRLTKEDQ